MTIEELNSRIAVVNAESNRINNERRVNIGKKETLTEQLNNAIAQYNKTYGTNIDITSLEAEINRVCALKEDELSKVETMLSLIKEGKFDEANKVASGEVIEESQVAVEQPVVQEVTPVIENPVQPAAPIMKPPVIEQEIMPQATPVAPVAQPVIPNLTTPTMPTAPVMKPPVIEQEITPPVAPPIVPKVSAPVQPSLSGLDIPTPPTLSGLDVPPVAPPPTAKPTNFNAILGGSAFHPQQN